MQHYELIQYILRIISITLGAVFLFFTLRAYLKHRTRPMLVLMVAIVLMIMASASEGAATQVLGLNLDQAHVIEAVFTLSAFAVLVWSILVPHRRGDLDIKDMEFDEGAEEG